MKYQHITATNVNGTHLCPFCEYRAASSFDIERYDRHHHTHVFRGPLNVIRRTGPDQIEEDRIAIYKGRQAERRAWNRQMREIQSWLREEMQTLREGEDRVNAAP